MDNTLLATPRGATFEDYGNPAGNQKTDKNNQSSIQILHSQGIYVVSVTNQVDLGINLMQRLITQGMLWIDPACQMLLTALRTGYVRDELGLPIGGHEGHPYADFADALRYAVVNKFQVRGPHRDAAVRRAAAPPPTPSRVPQSARGPRPTWAHGGDVVARGRSSRPRGRAP